jgi:hypothetical protein
MSRNPFGQLSVHRDEEDEDTPTQTQTQTTVTKTTQPLFSTQQEQKKKKKVRPDENKTTQESHDNDEGFQVVNKNKQKTTYPKTRNDDYVTDEKFGKDNPNKRPYKERSNFVAPGKRQFEKHSGTGRGKEISKGGAGGKHTWGANTKVIAKDAQKHEGGDYYDYRDEDYFNSALNAKPREKKDEKTVQETTEDKTTTTTGDNKDKEKDKTTTEQGEDTTNKGENVTGEEQFNDKRKKKKKGDQVDDDKKDLLERPENAISLTEWREQQKKNQNTTQKQVVRTHDTDLVESKKKDDEFLGIQSEQKKNKNKPKKEKKVDSKEAELNVVIGQSIKTDDGSDRRDDRRDNRGGRGKNWDNKNDKKFQFKAEDFPEL